MGIVLAIPDRLWELRSLFSVSCLTYFLTMDKLFHFSFHSVKLVLCHLLCISKAQQSESWKEASQGKKEVRLAHSADL